MQEKILAAHAQTIEVKEAHIDELGHVNNVQYVAWVQDIARAHWEKMTTEDMRKQVYWVVLRHEINYKRPSFVGEALRIETEVMDDISGPKWGRRVWIRNAQESIVIEAESQWCLVDALSGRPKRITREIESIFVSYAT